MKKIKTGVVAYGFSGKTFQCPFIEAHDAFELTAVVQRHGDEAKEDYPAITLFRDYEELLANEEIELIVISTPAHLHYAHALRALEAGKNVVVEKPFAATVEEALHLEALAKEKGKVITAYQNRRFDGDFLTVQQLVKEGVKIYEFEAVWDRFVPAVDENDWHEQGHQGADLLFDIGAHYVDQVLSLFGEPESYHGNVKILRPNGKIADYFSIEFAYADKIARVKSCMHAAKSDVRYKIHTDRGTYYFYVMGEQEHQLIAGMTPDNPDYGDNAMYDLFDNDGNKTSHQVVKGNYLMYFTMLADAIRTGGKPPVSTADAVRLIKYLNLATV